MNFLDAHKIVHDYYKIVEKEKLKNCNWIPIGLLQNSKEEISGAFKFFFAHTIYFLTRNQEEFDEYMMACEYIDRCVDNDLYDSLIESEKIAKEINEELNRPNKFQATMIGMTESLKISSYFPILLNKKNELFEIMENQCNREGFLSPVLEIDCSMKYCEYIYELYDIEMSHTDYLFFDKFEALENYLKNPEASKHFIGYEDYIRNNR